MRYEKAGIVLRIALDMQGLRQGVSLPDIQNNYTERPLSRSTAERLRDAIKQVFVGRMERANHDETPHRWRLKRGALAGLADLTVEELSALRTGVALLARENLDVQAKAGRDAMSKLRNLAPEGARNRLEIDLGILAGAEGIAVRQGPTPVIDPNIVASLRHAVLACRAVRITYTYRGTGRRGWDILRPLGFLWGSRHYLVADCEREGVWVTRNYALSNIHGVEILQTYFVPDESFSLQTYAERSFGVFQEEPFDVVWKFSPAVAADARAFHFHPTQAKEDQPDGSLLVRFQAGGSQAMAWHLHTWGEEVEVLEPKDFWERVER